MEKSKAEKIASIIESEFYAVEWYGKLTNQGVDHWNQGKHGLIVRVDEWNEFAWLTADMLSTVCRINGMKLTAEEAEEFISFFDE
jgi:hypothetical protein